MPFSRLSHPTHVKFGHAEAQLLDTTLQTVRSRVRIPMRALDFPIHLILPAALCPGVDSASNRSEYDDLDTSPPPVSRLSRKCKNLDGSSLDRPPRPVAGINVSFMRVQLARSLCVLMGCISIYTQGYLTAL
jgi:hypothetical protein